MRISHNHQKALILWEKPNFDIAEKDFGLVAKNNILFMRDLGFEIRMEIFMNNYKI
jgi:hypothetical protein